LSRIIAPNIALSVSGLLGRGLSRIESRIGFGVAIDRIDDVIEGSPVGRKNIQQPRSLCPVLSYDPHSPEFYF
jgi:hypothetical protein